MRFKYVSVELLNIREHPTMDSHKVGTLSTNDKILVLEEKEGFIRHEKGWSVSRYMSDSPIKKREKRSINIEMYSSNPNMKSTSKRPKRGEFVDNKSRAGTSSGAENNSVSNASVGEINVDASILESTVIRELKGLFGAPMNFTHEADFRPNGYQYGRAYTTNMIVDGGLVSLIPGEPDFLSELTKGEKEDAMKSLANVEDEKAKDTLKEIIDGKYARYYTFKPSVTEYFKYVNSLCWLMAGYLGIKNKGGDILGSSYGTYDWGTHQSSQLKNFFDLTSTQKYVAFYVDGQSSVSESMSNTTRESSLAGMTKGISDQVREGQFLMGAGAQTKMNQVDFNNYNEKAHADSGFLGQLGSSSKVITSGGNLVFPEIWGDFSFGKSYNLDIKFQSPSGDIEDIYLNVLVPYVHMLCLVAPRQISPNGYITPFLIRAFSKGWFNCDLGMIESVTVKKGGSGDSWSVSGLPTELELSVTIKDLYSSLSIANTDNAGLMMSNTGLIDHIATNCGININRPELKRRIESALILYTQKFLKSPSNWFKSIIEDTNTALNKYDSLSGH